jgi:hypothetical protein
VFAETTKLVKQTQITNKNKTKTKTKQKAPLSRFECITILSLSVSALYLYLYPFLSRFLPAKFELHLKTEYKQPFSLPTAQKKTKEQKKKTHLLFYLILGLFFFPQQISSFYNVCSYPSWLANNIAVGLVEGCCWWDCCTSVLAAMFGAALVTLVGKGPTVPLLLGLPEPLHENNLNGFVALLGDDTTVLPPLLWLDDEGISLGGVGGANTEAFALWVVATFKSWTSTDIFFKIEFVVVEFEEEEEEEEEVGGGPLGDWGK